MKATCKKLSKKTLAPLRSKKRAGERKMGRRQPINNTKKMFSSETSPSAAGKSVRTSRDQQKDG